MAIGKSQEFIHCKPSVAKRRKSCMKRSQHKHDLMLPLHQVASVSALLNSLSDLNVTSQSIASQRIRKGGNNSLRGKYACLFHLSLQSRSIEIRDNNLTQEERQKGQQWESRQKQEDNTWGFFVEPEETASELVKSNNYDNVSYAIK